MEKPIEKPIERSTGQQMRFTSDEIETIRNTFAGNDDLLKLLRKVFLPELDPKVVIGQGQMIDLWMTIPTKDRSAESIAIDLQARNMLISHIELMLQQLKVLSNIGEEPEVIAARLKKNSNK